MDGARSNTDTSTADRRRSARRGGRSHRLEICALRSRRDRAHQVIR
jgi:hypothetical protein